MFRRILLAVSVTSVLLLVAASPVAAQSRVRWGRSGGGVTANYQGPGAPQGYGGQGYGAQTYGAAQTPPIDPYALPPQGGIMGGPPSQPVMPPGYNAYPDPAFSGGPASQYPNGFGPVVPPDWGSGLVFKEPLRVIQGPRFRHAYLGGDDDRELGINETDISVAVAFPNFLGTTQPLYVLPSFSLQLWDGPKGPPQPVTADLPAQTYGAFIDAGWESDRGQMVGAELGLRVGVFSDFDTMNSNSLRIMGKGLVRYRITPALSLRAGVMYVDRLEIKLLPAGGLLWEPNSQTRFDLFFPNPKLSRYWQTVGTQDFWVYAMAEYGGGSWTIERAVDGRSDQFDYNDIRLIAGFEWGDAEKIRVGRRTGFIEAGWVLDREVLYRRRPQDNFRMTDTFMIRAGFGY